MSETAHKATLEAPAGKIAATSKRDAGKDVDAGGFFHPVADEAAKREPEEAKLLAQAAANIAMADGNAAAAVDCLIKTANRLGENGRRADAVELFEVAREYILKGVDQKRLNAAVANVHKKLEIERDLFRQEITALGKESAKHRVIILSDSLALPRDKQGHDGSALEETYPALIQEALNEFAPTRVTALCQRYGTMIETVEALKANKSELKGASVFIHIGLNDCATRIFMERERLALGLHPVETREKVVEFGRRYRAQIIAKNPDNCYVPLGKFKEQLEQAAKIVKVFGGRQLTLATIVQPPTRFDQKTPCMRWNFSRYNMEIYESAKNNGASVVDIDRLCWEHDTTETLISDGMHISRQGHVLMANAFADLWKANHGIS